MSTTTETKKPSKINAETRYVRSAKFTDKDGKKNVIMCQPYIVGMYLAVYVNDRIAMQNSLPYSKVPKMAKNLENDLKKDNTDVEVVYGKLGDFIPQKDFETYFK